MRWGTTPQQAAVIVQLQERCSHVLAGSQHAPRSVLARDSAGSLRLEWDVAVTDFSLSVLNKRVFEPLFDEDQLLVHQWHLDLAKSVLTMRFLVDQPWPEDIVPIFHVVSHNDSDSVNGKIRESELQNAEFTARNFLGDNCDTVSLHKLAHSLVEISHHLQRPGVLQSDSKSNTDSESPMTLLPTDKKQQCHLRLHPIANMSGDWMRSVMHNCAVSNFVVHLVEKSVTAIIDIA
jgi:hypothetical protein